MKFRKKPVIVDAYQIDHEEIIHTLEGDMKASPGELDHYWCKRGKISLQAGYF